MNRRLRILPAVLAALLVPGPGCTFLEAFEITYGDGKYKLARVTTDLSIPDLADLGTLSDTELSGQVAGLPADRLTLLSAREREVLALVLQGLPSKQIARRLSLSHRTVEHHRSRVLEKIGVGSMVELMRLNLPPFADLPPTPPGAT